MSDLAERLGYGADDKLVILTGDDLGLCHSANVGVYESLRDGLATSASLMVPCPWARGAAAQYRGEDVGVHLTLNAELDLYRWGPITQAPSLLDGDGGFPRTVDDVWDHADLDEVRRECRAQIERAILWGFDVSHLDTHLGVLQFRPEFFDVYLELAVEFRLPLRLPGPRGEQRAGFPFRSLAADQGVLFPDEVVSTKPPGDHPAARPASRPAARPASRPTSRSALRSALRSASPGVTEVHLRPAVASDELTALAPDWRDRTDDHELLIGDEDLRAELDEHGVKLVGYRLLREAMRSG